MSKRTHTPSEEGSDLQQIDQDQSLDLESLSPQQLRDMVQRLRARQAELEKDLALSQKVSKIPGGSKELLHRLVESAGDMIFLHDLEGGYIYYNGPLRYGIDPAELMGKTVRDNLPPEYAEPIIDRIRHVAETGERLRAETPIIWRGEKLWFSDELFPVRDEKGEIFAVGVISRTITELKRTERRLRESEERFRAIFDSAEDSIFLKDADLRYTHVNPAMERLFGMETSELIGKTDIELFGEEAGAHIEQIDSRVLGGEIVDEEHTKPVNGVPTTFHVIKVPVRDSSGEITGVCGIARDVTERYNAQKALAEAHQRFLAVLDGLDAHVYVADMKSGEILFMNKDMREDFGGDQTGHICWQVFRGESERCSHCTNDQLLDADDQPTGVRVWESQNPITGRYYINYDRAIRWVDDRWVRLQVATDITRRREAEEALQQSEQRLRNLIEGTEDFVFLHDTAGRYLYYNGPSRYGLMFDDMEGKTCRDFLPPEYAEPILKEIQAVVRTGERRRSEMCVFWQGEEIWTSDERFPVRDDEGKIIGVGVVSRNITDLKRTEAALRQTAERLEVEHEIDQAILAAQSPEAIAQVALQHLRELVPFYSAIITEVDLENDQIRALATEAEWELNIEAGDLLSMEEHHVDFLVGGQTEIVEDLEALDRNPRQDFLYQQGIRSYVVVPMVAAGQLVGAVNLSADYPGAFTAEHIEILKEVATSLAVAIRQARLYEQTERDAAIKSDLLREVKHRAGNNLARIQGLIYAERHRLSDEEEDEVAYEVLDRLLQRINGMIEVHHMLTEAKWAPMRLSAMASGIIGAALVSLPSSKVIDLTVTPSPVKVSPRQASHLALILNELATNTLKYALEDRNEGLIVIEIEKDDDTILLTYRDDGPGYPDPVEENIGLNLIHRLMEGTLGGEVTLASGDGAVTRLRFPVEEE